MLGRANIDRISPSGEVAIDASAVDAPETGLEQFDSYRAITDRPVFFADRRLPVVEVLEESEEDEPPPQEIVEEGTIDDLRAVVAGIVITPDMRLAMVRDEAANKTVMLREGMSLDGDQAAWRLERIQPRMVSFVSVDGRESDLELKVNTAGLTAGSPGQIRTPASRRSAPEPHEGEEQPEAEVDADAVSPADADARARAEEVRRRVAERRAELRAEAERRARMQQQRRDN
ncbi:MAG: hypothetical protein EA370_00390 [Wenzhouxiangella sp.]|nr:MAG: hypothetical protein EA370_00390 [Wenzhouxiangella sp.]